MIQQINFNEFCNRFIQMDKNDNFTYKGKEVLFNYLENLEEETGQNIELDIIALCCEYTEYANIEEYLKDYNNQHDKKAEKETEEEFNKRIEEEINDKTTLIKFGEDLNKGFIIAQY